MSRKTYKYSQSRGYQESESGEYDADHEKITTYKQDSKTKKWVLDINGKFNNAGKPVETYKYCKADREYRRDVRGIYDKNGKEISNLTAAVNSERSATPRTSAGPSNSGSSSRSRTETRPSSGANTSSSSSRPRTEPRNVPTADNSGGRRLTTEEIERQNLEDARATEHYNNPEAPPSYHGRESYVNIDRNNPLYAAQGIRGNQPVPRYTANAPSVPKPTNQTYALGRGNAPSAETFGGRRNLKVPLEYSSGDAKNRRGNNMTSSGELSRGYSSNSQNMFNMSGLSEGLSFSSEDGADKKYRKSGAGSGSSRSQAVDKNKDKEAGKKSNKEGKKPATSSATTVDKKYGSRQIPTSGSSSFADEENSSEDSPPQRSRTGISGRESGSARSDRRHADSTSVRKRDTSTQRKERKRKDADHAAAAAKRDHRVHKLQSSSDDELYRMPS
ncbi:predicted protein [Sclerotinia sclerotiorum 1980 UF-70]|uniref:Uncharacterized protein n=2 Tax=Sclerotinia sclerotiorum (strain ATCC 18683 / 1980 / Ss-1) TaxID=665079 RepID=A7F1M7_SCLS1|nr:predicted protein [Sclerotinia sclerotiorum 1980 UF-70]APA11268.1 hypothetical protein sscle_07g060380 [Sclerotinia sclerotiorum 1980 UF-70]EDN95619.1 predicted protein [Sclerotinia sclerotiorum 1980 UF-70]